MTFKTVNKRDHAPDGEGSPQTARRPSPFRPTVEELARRIEKLREKGINLTKVACTVDEELSHDQ
jgi:hypothetical protein